MVGVPHPCKRLAPSHRLLCHSPLAASELIRLVKLMVSLVTNCCKKQLKYWDFSRTQTRELKATQKCIKNSELTIQNSCFTNKNYGTKARGFEFMIPSHFFWDRLPPWIWKPPSLGCRECTSLEWVPPVSVFLLEPKQGKQNRNINVQRTEMGWKIGEKPA